MRTVYIAALVIWIGSLTFLIDSATAKEKSPCPTPLIRKVSPFVVKPGDTLRIQGWSFGTKEGEVLFQRKEKHTNKNDDVYKLAYWMADTIFPSREKAKIIKWTDMMIIVEVPKTAIPGPVTVSIPCGSVSNEYPLVVVEAGTTDTDTKTTPTPTPAPGPTPPTEEEKPSPPQ